MDPSTVLNELRIASPCQADWDRMKGDDCVRFCGSCDKHVYNLSALSADEAVDLLRKTGGKVCLQIYRRRDGTVLTADCPVGVKAAAARRLRRLWRIAAMVTGLWAIDSTLPVTERRAAWPLAGAWSKVLEARGRLLGSLRQPGPPEFTSSATVLGKIAPTAAMGTPGAPPPPGLERGEPCAMPAFAPPLLQETLGGD